MTRRLFGSLLALVFLVNFGRTAFAPLLPTLQSAFGVGPAAVGLVASLVWLGTGAVRLPVGYLLTRVGRHRVVVAAGVGLGVASVLTATATSVSLLQVGALGVGIASGTYFATAVPLIGDLYPDGIGRAVGVHGMFAQLASVVAPGAVVLVLALSNWRTTFWLLAATSLLAAVAVGVVLRREGVPSTAGADRNFRTALGHWRIVLAGVLMISTAGLVWQGLFNFYVSYLGTKGVASTTASGLLTVVFAAGVPAFALSGRLADRLPLVPYIVGLLVGFVAGVATLTAVSRLAPLVLATIVVGYTIHSLFPALDTYVLGALPAENRGSTYAVFTGVSILLEATGSGIVGALTEAGYAFDDVFRTLAAGLAVVVCLVVVLYLAGRLPGTPRSRSRADAVTE